MSIPSLKHCPRCQRLYTTDFCQICSPPSYSRQDSYPEVMTYKMEKLTDQINSLNQELCKKDKLIQEAQEDNWKQRQVIERLEKEKDAYDKKIKSLKQDIEKMDRQTGEDKKKQVQTIRKLEKENEVSAKRIKILEQEIQKMNKQIQEPQEDNKRQRQIIERLERENATYINKIQDLNQEIQKMNKQIQEPQEDNKRQSQIIERLENENATYAKQINILNQKIQKMESQIKEAQQESKTQVQSINSALDILKKENLQLRKELKDSQEVISNKNNKIHQPNNMLANIPEDESLLSFVDIFEKLGEDVKNVVKSNNLDPMGIRKAIEKEYHSKVKEHLLLLTNLCDKSMVTYKNILQELEATEQKLIENLINIPGMLTDEQRGRLSPLKGEKEKQEFSYKKCNELKEAISKLIK